MRSHFDLDPGLIYLNSGTHSISPRCVNEAVSRHRTEYERNPTNGLFSAWRRLWIVQKELAAFFNARPEDLFLATNVTHALNSFILGAPLAAPVTACGEILVSDLEYGAIVNQCRFRAERDGMNIRVLPLPSHESDFADLTTERLVNQVISALRPETRMLLLSHVMTANGLVMPLREIARETRARGVLLVVDGAHAPGAIPLDFSELEDVDYYAGNLHKWMMGPKGTAFGWVAPRNQASLIPTQAGWTTFEFPVPFREFGEGNAFQGKFMLTGCHDFSPFFGLKETLDFWRELGTAKISDRLAELRQHTEREVARLLGWPRLSPPSGPFLGPLLSYDLPSSLQEMGYSLMFRLRETRGLQISITPIQGRFSLRFSPHVYNGEEEISRGVEIVANYLRNFT